MMAGRNSGHVAKSTASRFQGEWCSSRGILFDLRRRSRCSTRFADATVVAHAHRLSSGGGGGSRLFLRQHISTMTQGKSQTILAGNFIVCVMMKVGARFVEIVREKEDGKSMKFVNLATVGPVFILVQVYMHPKSNGHTLDIFKLAKKHQGLRVSGVHVNHPKTRVDPLFVRVCRRYARPYSLATSPTILSGTRVANSSSRSGADMVVEELHSSRMSEELT